MYFFESFCKNEQRTEDSISWDLRLDPDSLTFMSHHFFAGECLVPGAIMAEMMLEAGRSLLQVQNPYPLTLIQFDIRRAIQVKIGSFADVQVRIEKNGESLHGFIYTDVKNQSGKIVRKDVLVATAEFSFSKVGIEEQTAQIGPFSSTHLAFGQQEFYDIFVKTHLELFQTLTGKLTLGQEKNYLCCDFSISDKEDRFSNALTEDRLHFILSPLGFDSILQTAVTFSVLNPPNESEFYYSKLPVSVSHLVLHEPFLQNELYQSKGFLETCDDTWLTLTASAERIGHSTICTIARITLKMAPFEKQSRFRIANALEVMSTGEKK